MARSNDVTLFSNGIGHFRRVYKVPAGKQESISIPFKRDNIGDVAASLQVFGNVRLNTPPSFTPSNANATSLRIDQNEALRSLLRSLSGATVTVALTDGGVPRQFVLLGLDTTTTIFEGSEVINDYIILSSEGKVIRKRLTEVESVHFDDESVRTEIDKALKNNFQLIKPDSTLLDISLTAVSESDTEAVIQYTIPVASWKMRYAIREVKGKFTLEGAAIIDNNTDEDWDNFSVSVVTGNPISFQTDIATVSVPRRKFVQLVDGSVLGNVDVEEGYQMEAMAAPAMACASRGSSRALRSMQKSSVANYAQFGMARGDLESVGSEDLDADSSYSQVLAESAGVDSKDVGDFCVFTSKEPITILARKSAVVPMFAIDLKTSGIVLLYKEGNHSTRPYRAVKFKNESTYSLGKGKTVIYNDGIFSGECVLESTKPGENRMLPHCLENGVKITKENKSIQNRRSALRISDGIAIVEDVSTGVTTYTIVNKKSEPFKLALEHVNLLHNQGTSVEFTGAELKEKEKLTVGNGYRVYLELGANQTVTVTATETAVNSQQFQICQQFNWVRSNIIDVNSPIATDKQILACVKAQEQIDVVVQEITAAQEQHDELEKQMVRVRNNLNAAKASESSTLVTGWIKDLDLSEKEIRQLDKDLMPNLKKKLKAAQAKLTTELKKLTIAWKDS